MRLKQLGRKHRASIQEERSASRFGGKVQPGSGCFKHWKLDVSSHHFLVECKFTDKDSYSIKKSLLETVRREAAKEGKQGIIELDINGELVYVVPKDLMEVMAGTY